MDRGYRPPPGTPIDELDTPCLIIDMDALEHNMQVVADFYRDRACKLRPHVKNHKTPIIAHMQIRTGGTVGGVCASKVAEAEVMVQGGISNVFITNQIVTRGQDCQAMLPGAPGRDDRCLRRPPQRPRSF